LKRSNSILPVEVLRILPTGELLFKGKEVGRGLVETYEYLTRMRSWPWGEDIVLRAEEQKVVSFNLLDLRMATAGKGGFTVLREEEVKATEFIQAIQAWTRRGKEIELALSTWRKTGPQG